MEPDQLWLLARIAQKVGRDTTTTLANRLALGDGQCKALMARWSCAVSTVTVPQNLPRLLDSHGMVAVLRNL